MNPSSRMLSLTFVVLIASPPAFAAVEPLEVKGKVDAVTVYRGQALVTRLVDIVGPAGLREVVVTDLPENVLPGSIFAESADGVEVRSVRYRARPVSEDVREEVRELDEQIRTVQDKLDANTRQLAVLNEHNAYLGKLEGFVAPTATTELSKGVLNAETLTQLSNYLLEQRKMVSDERLRLSLEARELQKQLDLLQRQKQQLTAGSSRTLREAIVFVNLQKAEGNTLRLRYLVNNATWTPSYNVRAEDAGQDVRVEYYASIQQLSGEEWPDVTMTLSTATPALVAKAPDLVPLTVTLAALEQQPAQAGQQRLDAKGYAAAREELNRKKLALENTRNNNGDLFAPQPIAQQALSNIAGAIEIPAQSQRELDLGLNTIAQDLQMLDLVARAPASRSARPAAPATDEGLTVTYQLAGRTSLPSRADQQLIQIAALPMKAEFYKLALPVLTSYVYNEAAVTNSSDRVLLAGPVAAYLAGQFVGHGAIPTVAVGENFTLGFGIDSSLRAGRELVEKAESVQGGNRVVDFTYRLIVENFGAAPADVRLLDRLPTAKDNEVKIELTANGTHKISEDSTYQQTQRKKGILRWDVQAPAQAAGPQALGVEYKLRLEYDKQMSISGMPVASR